MCGSMSSLAFMIPILKGCGGHQRDYTCPLQGKICNRTRKIVEPF
jgi:hypothetical protein